MTWAMEISWIQHQKTLGWSGNKLEKRSRSVCVRGKRKISRRTVVVCWPQSYLRLRDIAIFGSSG